MITQDKIIEWAREVGAHRYTNRHFPEQPAFAFNIERLTAFAQLVEQYRKEKDAGICDRFGDRGMHPYECAAAIRNQE